MKLHKLTPARLIALGFLKNSADGVYGENTETAIEVDRDLRATFMEHAGEGARFTYVHALNDALGLIGALADAVQDALAGQAPDVLTTGLGADTNVPRPVSGHCPAHK